HIYSCQIAEVQSKAETDRQLVRVRAAAPVLA
ncbi:uncharacterized, partial [Tachysurus ichikawai]